MKIVNFSLVIIGLLFFINSAVINVPAQSNGQVITVTNNGDSLDINPGDNICADSTGQCTFRAAIQEANATPGNDVIIFALSRPSVIDLSIGQLPISQNVAIVGPGARALTLQRSSSAGTPDFRIFNVPNNSGTNIIIRGITIKNGNALNSPSGGGINVERGNTVNLTDVAISNNRAVVGGGIANAGTVNLMRCLLNSNTANAQGGAIINLDSLSVFNIFNSTITNNSAETAGAINNNGNLLLVNNTITNNFGTNLVSSTSNGSGGTINILNTIIGNDASSVNTLQGSFTSYGSNIITDARGSTGFVNGVNNDQVSNNNTINPLLENLADNGGQTDTRALQPGSPAINRGNNCVRTGTCSLPSGQFIRLTSDQRINHNRLIGQSVDIGAFEAGAAPVTGSLGFGALGRSRPSGGGLAILTSAGTGDKLYSFINPFGSFTFQNLSISDVYILEIRNKRLSFNSPLVFAFDTIPFSTSPENEAKQLTLDLTKGEISF